jgi:hypothetical protein
MLLNHYIHMRIRLFDWHDNGYLLQSFLSTGIIAAPKNPQFKASFIITI